MQFVRTAHSELTRWYGSKSRKPLIIRGARQVGKSTLVRHFAESAKLELVEINLEQHPELDAIFDTLKVEPVLREIGAIARRDLMAVKHPLIFLDEIQATPRALRWLRYIYEEKPHLAVIAAGSLLEFAIKDAEFSMPVGRVDYLWLHPMSFAEYLVARGDSYLQKQLDQTNTKSISSFTKTTHQELMTRQREYLVVGGMPAVVKAFIEEGVHAARDTQQGILTSYLDDLAKYARRHPLARLQRIFRAVPGALGTRVKYVHLSRHDQNRDIKEVLDLLEMAGIILPVYHSDCSGIPVSGGEDSSAFKLIFLDVGLACRALGLDWKENFNMDETRLVNEGPLAEQFVGQELVAATPPREPAKLHFWRRDKAQSRAEIDYVMAIGRQIIPIEVKAGATGTLRSLHQYILAKNPPFALRFDASMPSEFKVKHTPTLPTGSSSGAVSYRLLSLPLYFVGQGSRLASDLLDLKPENHRP